MTRRIQLTKYLFSDYLTAGIAWALFSIYRKEYIEPIKYGYDIPIKFGSSFYMGIFLLPVFWILLYYASGYYRQVMRKSRLAELWFTLRITVLGIVILFFGLLLDDTIDNYSNYYQSFMVLLTLHFTLTYIPRLIITTHMTHKIHRGEYGFSTLMIGGNDKAFDIYTEMQNQPQNTGNKLIGFVSVDKNGKEFPLETELKHLGTLQNIKEVIAEHEVEEVIIALEYSEHNRIEKILNLLIDTNVVIKAIPGMYEIFTGKVKMSSILGTPLIEISHQLMPAWQENLKHFVDIIFSLLALILSLPLTSALIIGVKLSSSGPIFYKQTRIGKNGKPFKIFKFRSMYVDAEAKGPELSSLTDTRVTPFGRFMRKSRFDEIPNFINVLRGDMSLVGPRPERQHFINQIVERAPQYIQLLKVKPGITSWGQVKYGYAENVDQMLRRMKYDLIYLENMTLYVDFKIMIYTLMIIYKGKGI